MTETRKLSVAVVGYSPAGSVVTSCIHECNWYCRGDIHAELGYSTEDIFNVEDARAWIATRPNPYEIVDVVPAREAPRLGEVLRPSGRIARSAVLITYRRLREGG